MTDLPAVRAELKLRGDDTGRPLTPRQRELLMALVRLGTMKEAAQSIGISYRTTKEMMASIFRKLGMEKGSAVRAVWLLCDELKGTE